MDYKRDIFDGDDVSIEVSRRGKIKRFFSRNFSNKFKNLKIKYKKDPKKFAVVTLGLLVAISALIGSSYAYLTYISKTNSSTVINAGTLALVFKNDSNAITLDGALPMKDSDGLNSKDIYEFSIENTGSISATYRVTLDNTCSLGKSYEVGGASVTPNICIPDNYVKVGISENGGEYKVLERKSANEESSYIIATGSLNAGKTISYKMKIWLDYSTPNTYNTTENSISLYAGKLGLSYEQGNSGNLDKSGANEPVLDDAMIPVYYDETSEVWRKADSTNQNKSWFDYSNKKWANSVIVNTTEFNNTYKDAAIGTEIPMDKILTMQVWIPRYKYKVWNYNADGTKSSNEQQIEITFENGTNTTGEISCQDAISGTDGDPSETCKLKSTNATCTDDTCNGKTYTHPAFTFGNKETKGFWIGKFEVSATDWFGISAMSNQIDSSEPEVMKLAPSGSTTGDDSFSCIYYDGTSSTKCSLVMPLTKPNVHSWTNSQLYRFEQNMMRMNSHTDYVAWYGLNTNTDTHMIKNSEWGAVAYLSHSKYGTCTDGTCKEIEINNNSNYITGCGAAAGSSSSATCNAYNTATGMLASTTGNIYGVYDMNGGGYEFTMANIVSNDGSTMMSGNDSSYNSGYTGKVYDSGKYTSYTGIAYPDTKYYDKYSFSTNDNSRIRSKLGDGMKEVYNYNTGSGWYSDAGSLASSDSPWFERGGGYFSGTMAGVFFSIRSNGNANSYASSRLVITP